MADQLFAISMGIFGLTLCVLGLSRQLSKIHRAIEDQTEMLRSMWEEEDAH